MTNARPLRRRTAALMVTLAALAGTVGLTASPAPAIPGDGAGPDTPGTSSQISTPQVAVGGRISFSVSGYPGGETLYVKIDDERFCQAPPFGACVFHQQKIGANGSVSGSFALPATLPAGSHTLRFLASEETAEGLQGYTRRSPAFTVVAAAGASGSGTGAGGGSAGAGSSGTSSGTSGTSGSTGAGTSGATGADAATTAPVDGTTPAAGGVLAVAPRGEVPAANEGAKVASGDGSAVVTSTPAAATAPVVSGEDLTAVPWIGLYVLVGCILASSVISTVTVLRRRRSTV